MSFSDSNDARKASAGRRYASHGKAAEILDVSGRTLDRWIEAGILPQPAKVRGRKYHDLDVIENVHSKVSA